MRTLIFATNNQNKVSEIQKICPPDLKIISLKEAGIDRDIEEPFGTLLENAHEKTRVIFGMTGRDCFAEDSGLEVDALNGAPGVFSARYAGPQKSDTDNIVKLLQDLNGVENRTARFRTVISFRTASKLEHFEGTCEGTIAEIASGNNGFGYDPVFIPYNYNSTFAALLPTIKLEISHRTAAFAKFSLYLSNF